MEIIGTLMSYLSMGCIAGGTLWGAWGGIQLAQSFGENGPEMKQGIWKIVGGAIMIAVGGAIAGINIAFA